MLRIRILLLVVQEAEEMVVRLLELQQRLELLTQVVVAVVEVQVDTNISRLNL